MTSQRSPEDDAIVAGRLRNRIIEYLETFSSKEQALEYQKNVPIAQVSSELFNQWDEVFNDKWVRPGFYSPPVYSEEEIKTLLALDKIIDETSRRTSKNLPYIVEFVKTKEFASLSEAMRRALKVFMVKGPNSKYDQERLSSE